MQTLESLTHDLRYAWRALATHARFTVLVALTLALTIGATTAVFSVANAVLLRPLPYADSDDLVWVWSVRAQDPLKQRASFPDFRDWRAQTRTLDLVGHGGLSTVLTGAGEPERLRAELFVGDLLARGATQRAAHRGHRSTAARRIACGCDRSSSQRPSRPI